MSDFFRDESKSFSSFQAYRKLNKNQVCLSIVYNRNMVEIDIPNEMRGKKVALVHDFLLYPGGAEKTLLAICELFPEAPIYTILYDHRGMLGMFAQRTIIPSFLQKMPVFVRKHYRFMSPLFASAVESFDLREFDIVISSSGAWSKGVVTKLKTYHIAYIHSPMRYVWDYNERYWKERGRKPSLLTRFFLTYFRQWDRLAADRPESLIANSIYTQQRVSKYYRRSSKVVYPPVDVFGSLPTKILSKPKTQFVVISRLSAYKRLDIVVEAFNKLNLPLVVIGDGPERKRLESLAGSHVSIVGWQSQRRILEHFFPQARAFIFPCEDDFGIAPVEAMQYGIPVIAYAKGGIVETMQEGATGELFEAQTVEVLCDAVRRFLEKETLYDRAAIARKAERFSRRRFQEHFIKACQEYLEQNKQ